MNDIDHVCSRASGRDHNFMYSFIHLFISPYIRETLRVPGKRKSLKHRRCYDKQAMYGVYADSLGWDASDRNAVCTDVRAVYMLLRPHLARSEAHRCTK